MNPEIQKVLQAERKRNRELVELNNLRDRVLKTKNPDQKMLAAIDAEIKARDI